MVIPSLGKATPLLLINAFLESPEAVEVWDRMPQRSADRYGGRALDATPAVMERLEIPFGRVGKIAYGRAIVNISPLKSFEWR